MADDRTVEMTRDERIAEISSVQDALEALNVKRERIRFDDLPGDALPDVLESVREQLKRRKKFLGVK